MLDDLLTAALSLTPSEAALVALAAALPTLLVLYVRFGLRAGRLRVDLSLSRLEAIELRRAMVLYGKASRQREEIHRQRKPLGSGLLASYRGRVAFKRQFGKELDELEHYLHDLRATIMRLRSRPLQRLRSCIRIHSAQSALGRALLCHCSILALLTALPFASAPLPWAAGMASLDDLAPWQTFSWQTLNGRLLLANAIAAACVVVLMPPLYLVRRAQLLRWNEPAVSSLTKFATADPEQSIDPEECDAQERAQGRTQERDTGAAQETAENAPPVVPEIPEESTWLNVLGLSSSATIDDVKQAYKTLVKQSHPDRVHGMAPVFRELAEAETKRINIAYAEALTCLGRHDKQEMAGTA